VYKALCIAVAVIAVTLASERTHEGLLFFAATASAAGTDAGPKLAQAIDVNKQGGARARIGTPSYRVTGVAGNDVLNIRSAPSADRPIVGTIPPSGRGIRIVDRCDGQWCPIEYGGIRGWVNRRYLTRE
jgi:hypothetical protein